MSIIRVAADHFRSGDWPMWPILGIFIIAIAIIVERFVYLRRTTVDKRQLMALLKSQLMAGNVQGAIKLCSGNPTPLTRIVRAGLSRWTRPDDEVQAAMDEAALEELPLLERRTGYLAMLSNLATLVGLLGTIIGLIDAFAGTAGVDASMKSVLLAKGISEAMNCTAFGLITGVSSLIGYSVLNGWTQRTIDDINEVSVKVINLVVGHRTAMREA
jgi:biopolymer transport protein ExbB/TolQ